MCFPNLRAEIARQGKKPSDIACAAGVTTRTVYKWLNGEASPNVEKAKLVSDYIGKPMDHLFGDIDPNE